MSIWWRRIALVYGILGTVAIGLGIAGAVMLDDFAAYYELPRTSTLEVQANAVHLLLTVGGAIGAAVAWYRLERERFGLWVFVASQLLGVGAVAAAGFFTHGPSMVAGTIPALLFPGALAVALLRTSPE